jgi:hypothetical protein
MEGTSSCVQRELKSHLLRGVCVGPDPVCDLVVHEHAGKEAIAHVEVLEDVAVVLRKDEALGACLPDEFEGVDEPLRRSLEGRLPRRGAQHDHARHVGRCEPILVAAEIKLPLYCAAASFIHQSKMSKYNEFGFVAIYSYKFAVATYVRT